jgi:hypothetical protein
MNSSNQELDDLKILGNIGDKRQAFIREKLKVRTYKDLAGKKAEEIAAVFQAANKPISRKIIEQWITNAAKEAKKAKKAPARVNSSSPRKQKGKIDTSSSNEEAEWEWLQKVFFVEFRVLRAGEQIKEREMRVIPRDTSRNGIWVHPKDVDAETPEVLQGEQLYPWMVQQLGEQAWQMPDTSNGTEKEPSLAAQPTKPQAIDTTPVSVAVKQIIAYKPADAETPIGIGEKGQPFEGSIEGDESFDLEVVFELPDLTKDDLLERELSFKASFFVQTADEKISLGDTNLSRLEPGEVFQKARLTEVTLQPASYRLGVIVKVRTSPSSLAYLVTPEFQVSSMRDVNESIS